MCIQIDRKRMHLMMRAKKKSKSIMRQMCMYVQKKKHAPVQLQGACTKKGEIKVFI